jgi:hypothetical protein
MNNGWVLGTAQTENATLVFSDQDNGMIFDILSEVPEWRSVIVLE